MIVSPQMIAIFVYCMLSIFGADAVADETEGLGLSRDELITLATGSGALAPGDFEVATLSSGESVLVGGAGSRFRIAAFGDPDDIHTLRFDLFGENARREDPAALNPIVADMVSHLFPNWPDASSWPRSALDPAGTSLRAAVEHAREAASREPSDRRRRYEPAYDLDLFSFSQEVMRHDKWLAAFPWLMGYSCLITTHPGCLPTRGRRYWKSLSLGHFDCFQ